MFSWYTKITNQQFVHFSKIQRGKKNDFQKCPTYEKDKTKKLLLIKETS